MPHIGLLCGGSADGRSGWQLLEPQACTAIAQLDLLVQGLMNNDLAARKVQPFMLLVYLKEAIAPANHPVVLHSAWFLPTEDIVDVKACREASMEISSLSGLACELPVKVLEKHLFQIVISGLNGVYPLQPKGLHKAILKDTVSPLYASFSLG
jgi:hypothetical protein